MKGLHNKGSKRFEGHLLIAVTLFGLSVSAAADDTITRDALLKGIETPATEDARELAACIQASLLYESADKDAGHWLAAGLGDARPADAEDDFSTAASSAEQRLAQQRSQCSETSRS